MNILAIFLMLFVLVTPVFGQLDLEQEVLIIPDTHDAKPYIWDVMPPRGFNLVIENSGSSSELGDQFSLVVKSDASAKIENIHVFITDEDLHTYAHVLPTRKTDGAYAFDFKPPLTAKYRFEVVFRTDRGWVDLRKDIKLKKVDGKAELNTKPGDEDYTVKIKPFPRKIYAEHVGTLLYEISFKGTPLKEIEKMDGFDMQVAAWDEDLKEFIYMTPKQNFGGPEVAVSIVFMRPGKHAIFAEFKHNAYMRKIETVIDILAEPRSDAHSIENMKSSE